MMGSIVGLWGCTPLYISLRKAVTWTTCLVGGSYLRTQFLLCSCNKRSLRGILMVKSELPVEKATRCRCVCLRALSSSEGTTR